MSDPVFPDPDSRNPLAGSCKRCPALVDARERIAWGNGSLDADLLVVGEAPGAGTPEADHWRGGNWTGMAYTARHSGRKIRTLCSDLGYDHDQLYFTNAVKCFPEDVEDGGNREPTVEEQSNCRPYLLEEIDRVDPEAVLATGAHATRSLLATAGIELDGFLDSILEPIVIDELKAPILPVLHPSYREVWLSRLGYTYEQYLRAIENALQSS